MSAPVAVACRAPGCGAILGMLTRHDRDAELVAAPGVLVDCDLERRRVRLTCPRCGSVLTWREWRHKSVRIGRRAA